MLYDMSVGEGGIFSGLHLQVGADVLLHGVSVDGALRLVVFVEQGIFGGVGHLLF